MILCCSKEVGNTESRISSQEKKTHMGNKLSLDELDNSQHSEAITADAKNRSADKQRK